MRSGSRGWDVGGASRRHHHTLKGYALSDSDWSRFATGLVFGNDVGLDTIYVNISRNVHEHVNKSLGSMSS